MPKIIANGLTTYYQQSGQGSDVVLIHGLTGNLSTWYLHVMPALAKEFRVTAYDLRGHGYSELTPSGYTSAHFAADLEGLLDRLGIERAHLVGYSFGATVALHCAVLCPSRVASLVLAEPWISVLRPLVDLKKWPYREAAHARFKARGLAIPEERWLDIDYVLREALRVQQEVGGPRAQPESSPFRVLDPTQRANPKEVWQFLAERWSAPRRLLRLLDDTSAMKEAVEVAGLTMERIAEVRQPTLAIYGEFSPFLQLVPRVQAAMPDCQVLVLEGAAHYFALVNPELLMAAVRKFLHELTNAVAAPPGEMSGSTERPCVTAAIPATERPGVDGGGS
jgi:pimeloyl-ACP methyl ester carboxylesterase